MTFAFSKSKLRIIWNVRLLFVNFMHGWGSEHMRMHDICKYFNDQKWTLQDFINKSWTKHPDYNKYYLGTKKNEAGQCINCKGVEFDARNGNVLIAYFDENGGSTEPYTKIGEYGCYISN